MRWILFFLLAALSFTGARAQTSNDSAMGLWPWLVKNVNSDIPKIVADTKNAGMDTIYVSVFRVKGRLWGSLPVEDESGLWNKSWGTVTPYVKLSALISKAHAEGLQVVGVMSCFLPGKVDPTDTAHQKYLVEKVIGYFFDHFRADGTPWYDLDGMCLDYVRFGAGHNRPTKAVNDFLDRIKARFPWLPLHAYVIANAYSYDGPVYTNSFRSYSGVIKMIADNFGQNYEQMASRLDVILPMAYISNGGVYGSNKTYMKGYVRTVASYVRRAMTIGGSPSTKVIVAIKTYGQADTGSVNASASGALAGGAHGFMPFRYYTCKSSWLAVLKNYTVPGTNRPVAGLAFSTKGQSMILDPTLSHDGQDPTSKLTLRFDWDGDGRLDTPILKMGTLSRLAPSPGNRTIGMQVTDTEGLTAWTRRRVYVPNSLTLSFPMLSASQGGKILFPCDAGPAGAGRFYLTLGSATGTAPGIPLGGGVTIPLVYDSMTFVTLLLGGSSVFPGSLGYFPSTGKVSPAFAPGKGVLPPALVGSKLYFAMAFFSPGNFFPEGATNPVTLYIIP